ncbi:co-chaperone YbbN [Arcobacter sp. LA11]|uniref:thioredoxin family protein n=1 Tax=Arcobacter sp. LA11 TaxID=1898176 RepID=UPI000934A40C|nr:thioredoxin domain-containing protein [Arcobacter sp. LA11]
MKKVLIGLIFSFISLFAFEHLETNNIDEKLKGKNAIVDFYATWCPPCKVLAKNLILFDKVKPADVVIYKIDIDEYMNLAKKYNVRSLPTLIYFKDGKVIAKEVGIKDVNQLAANSMKYFK